MLQKLNDLYEIDEIDNIPKYPGSQSHATLRNLFSSEDSKLSKSQFPWLLHPLHMLTKTSRTGDCTPISSSASNLNPPTNQLVILVSKNKFRSLFLGLCITTCLSIIFCNWKNFVTVQKFTRIWNKFSNSKIDINKYWWNHSICNWWIQK